jgi:hypothetical protein
MRLAFVWKTHCVVVGERMSPGGDGEIEKETDSYSDRCEANCVRELQVAFDCCQIELLRIL